MRADRSRAKRSARSDWKRPSSPITMSEGIADTLARLDFTGHQIGPQLYPDCSHRVQLGKHRAGRSIRYCPTYMMQAEANIVGANRADDQRSRPYHRADEFETGHPSLRGQAALLGGSASEVPSVSTACGRDRPPGYNNRVGGTVWTVVTRSLRHPRSSLRVKRCEGAPRHHRRRSRHSPAARVRSAQQARVR